MNGNNQQQLLPFRMGARQRQAKVGTITHTTASTLTPLELPRVGMLSRIVIQFRGTANFSAAGALADLGPWSTLSRIKVNANIGSAALVDVSGFGAFVAAPKFEEEGFRPDLAGVGGGTTPNADIHAAALAAGDNTWVLTWVIPISANAGRQFDLGLINLQAPETRVTVELSTGALADIATNFSTLTGTYHVYYEYYEIPDPNVYQLPPLALVRLLEEQQPISQTGDNIFTVPRQGVLLQLHHVVRLNGARNSADVDRLSIKFNKTDTVYDRERQWSQVLYRLFNALNPITGVFEWDFWHSESDISAGDTRDTIDSEELSTLESIVAVASGATLGSNNNFLNSVRRIVQILQ